ncbi:hypothetical protein LSH36_1893g00011 [Paralvinella palmiformis]|uniref:Uncharacterized protein n=1 Tax=Paralvinella palmiformis TaxID=53620 RepID=A0AAD9MLH0_9ANNE|nr:hypothetical protein LSH36_1893g00011 [Paralvinella palmiformis]
MTDNIGYVVEHEEGASIQLQNGKHLPILDQCVNRDSLTLFASLLLDGRC